MIIKNIAIGLAWTMLLTSVLPAVVSIFSYNSRENKSYVFLSIFLVLRGVLNVLSAIVYYNYPSNTIELNIFFTLNETLFLMLYLIFFTYSYKTLFTLLAILLLVVTTFQFFSVRLTDFDFYLIFFSIVVTLMCLFSFGEIFRRLDKNKLTKKPDFYFVFAIILMNLPQIMIDTIGTLWQDYMSSFPYATLIIRNLMSVASSLLFAFGFYYLAKNKKRIVRMRL